MGPGQEFRREPPPRRGSQPGWAAPTAATPAATPAAPSGGAGAAQSRAVWMKRLTGADRDTNLRWQVAGTNLGIPYVLGNGSIGYLFGDTFDTPWPEAAQPNNWRSPVMLRSNVHPATLGGVVFDSAARVTGDGPAPELMHNGHHQAGIDGLPEVTVLPNDGISFHETGRHVISYMSVEFWALPGVKGPQWKSRYAGLAYSDNGSDFTRTSLKWFNDPYNASPYQMWTMQRDGEWVYIFSVRSGRQPGPMMLRRVNWDRILSPADYQGWGWHAGTWAWGRPCTPILTGHFGEPSVRKLVDGTWAMAYLNCANGSIVTRVAEGPDRPWSPERVQVDSEQEPGLSGGFIHPWSTRSPNGLHLLVSKWTRASGVSTAYHVSQYLGSL